MKDLTADSCTYDIPLRSNVHGDHVRKGDRCSGNRIRLRDARHLYLLVGECRAAGVDGLVWRRLLTSRLRSLFDADFVTFIDQPVAALASTDSSDDPIGIVENGCLCDDARSFVTQILETLSRVARSGSGSQQWAGARVLSRLEFRQFAKVRDGGVHQLASRFAQRGDYLVGINPGQGDTIQALGLFRKSGKPRFSRRTVHMLRALWVELRILQLDELASLQDSVFVRYPKRMLQVLSCLLAGNTARETATLLSISVHTVQEHTKRLYKRTDTSNRAELADFFHDVAPLLIATPINEYRDFQPNEDGIVRDSCE